MLGLCILPISDSSETVGVEDRRVESEDQLVLQCGDRVLAKGFTDEGQGKVRLHDGTDSGNAHVEICSIC